MYEPEAGSEETIQLRFSGNHYDVYCSPGMVPHDAVGGGEGDGGAPGEEEEEEDIFCICSQPWEDGVPMIMCSNAECESGLWFHQECLGIHDAKEWKKMSGRNYVYTCFGCVRAQNKTKRQKKSS